MDCDVLTLAGIWNSGPSHWQTHWEKRNPAWKRVAHRDWNNPERHEWVDELDAAIAMSEGPPILVAHSLSCALVAHWARSESALSISGAFLVAPADAEAASFPSEAVGFAPMQLHKLPFPSIVVASANDPYVSIERARAFAQAWGSRFVEIGDAGHINGDSGYGDWPEGEKLLGELCRQVPA
ncbi:alpha/beta hydrolase [Massilia antarctica]|uniref:Alpha/beta hydrolase n=1 Tax=Massilia antarctica TaxID=2765360 RepID=A0AA48W9K0_9BURK|nr:alpha/beta hydrolase [Massilia antarctica]QPI47489.1 alpha/beta hydrolase [Massilia antarctica]